MAWKILRRFPRYHTKIRRAQKMIQRHPYLFVTARFMYTSGAYSPLIMPAVAAQNFSAAEYCGG